MGHRRATLGLVLTCLFLQAQPRPARAGACPGAQVSVYPETTVMAPTNVVVRLVFDEEEVKAHGILDPRTRTITKTGFVKASTAQVALRDLQGREVPVTLHRLPATRKPILLVKPVHHLMHGSRFEVILRSGTEDYVISHLHTGAGPTTVPPTIGKVELAIYSAYPRAMHWKDPTGRYAFVTLGAGVGVTAYEVHELDGTRSPSEATLRALLHHPLRGTAILRLEEGGSCHGANFRFPTVRRGASTHPLRLGIRALDDAGNRSELREVTLDLAKPGRYIRPRSPGRP